MKIVVAHNYYGSEAPSGENQVFEAELQLLRSHGHEVRELTRHSDDLRRRGIWGSLRGGLSTPWNAASKREAEKLLRETAADILHVHNSFPLLSPAIFYAAAGTAAATVLTLHNYRTYCAAGIPLRDGKPCTACLDTRRVRPALRYRCYRQSLAATIPMAAMIWLHRFLKTWERQVDAFIALTAFQKELLCQAGLPEERVFVKPHFYQDPPTPVPWSQRQDKIVYVGRLTPEKGCQVLLAAWRLWGEAAPQLEMIGDGPERSHLAAYVKQAGMAAKVIFRGQVSFQEAQASLATARLLILPSLCFEGFPMVIREAYALGVPVAASRLGSMVSLIQEEVTGTLFEAGNPIDLLNVVQRAWEAPRHLAQWGEAARQAFADKFTAAANYQMLLEIYQSAIQWKREKIQVRH